MAERGARDLSGQWQFMPADARHEDLPEDLPDEITVPGLWEAQGYPRLDGAAWYRRVFELDDVSGEWSLEFGAVMDAAEVYLNDQHVGGHDGAYTPFVLPVTPALLPGRNVLDVRVVDHPLDSHEHRRRAHGKQGWMNQIFPSPPSLYMTYGGIWQRVRLLSHGPVRVADVHVVADPAALSVEVELANPTHLERDAQVRIEILGRVLTGAATVHAGGSCVVVLRVGAVDAPRWTPNDPVLHDAVVEVTTEDSLSDSARRRFGLRTFTVHDGRFHLNDEPLFLRAALVQGFRDDTLYAEGSRAQIEAEVLAAQQAGLNMLRLHVKAFDPVYLDVCDELGMLVHADLPVAEPIVHAELGYTGELVDACRQAIREQVRRDRNHPSLVLWSAMNELCAENKPGRQEATYEAFSRALYKAVDDLDRERPVIENDWVEPDPDYVFCSPMLTAHWYGRLSEPYLRDLAAKVAMYAHGSAALYVSEFGDWGLPFPEPDEMQTWWTPNHLRASIEALPWGGSVEEFIAGTQRYQGISDRLQGEIIRAYGSAGWCITELTDVPQEFNGLWTLRRDEKTTALAEITTLCQPVLPVVTRTTWTFAPSSALDLPIRVVNDGPGLEGVELTVQLDGNVHHRTHIDVPAASVATLDPITIHCPDRAGDYTLDVTITTPAGDTTQVKSTNTYLVHATSVPGLEGVSVDLISGADDAAAALAALGAQVTRLDTTTKDVSHQGRRALVIGEGALSARAGEHLQATLARGGDALVLAQPAAAAAHLPIGASAVDITTEWGSTPFLFTTDACSVAALGPRRILTTEALAVVPDVVYTDIGGSPWADLTMVGMLKPYPGEIAGTALGAHRVGSGRLWLCQLPLTAAVSEGQVCARGILAQVLALVHSPAMT